MRSRSCCLADPFLSTVHSVLVVVLVISAICDLVEPSALPVPVDTNWLAMLLHLMSP